MPGSDAVELTGEVSSMKHSEAVTLSRLILRRFQRCPCTVGGETRLLYHPAILDERSSERELRSE